MKHWLAVVSLEHAELAFACGFLQVCHGKAAPLRRVSAGDEFFIYCPKTGFRHGDSLMSVHFQGRFADDQIYQVEQCPGFHPFRRDVAFNKAFRSIPIRRVTGLSLVAKPSWGMILRRGFLELADEDAARIVAASEAQP